MKLFGFSTYFACILVLLETNGCISELELSGSEEGDELDHECSVMLNAFAESASNFTHCAVKNARPFRFCCMCSIQYSRLIKCKNDIYYSGNFNCFNQLVGSLKYQIVERMLQFANTLWYTSHCDACLKQHNNDEEWQVTDVVKAFFRELRELKLCFKNNSQVGMAPVSNSTIKRNSSTSNSTWFGLTNVSEPLTVCNKCLPYYNKLKNIYKHEFVHKEGAVAICADVAAAMNYTRHTWSREYACTKPQTDLISVVALTCFFGFIPFVFYVAVTINGQVKSKRMEIKGLPKINYDTE